MFVDEPDLAGAEESDGNGEDAVVQPSSPTTPRSGRRWRGAGAS
jgi:hypothetical protein